ncbi:MAG: hypothetical protein Q7S17_07790 [Xanthobacteraceae bacterium]|nr:hypothetical protein [Xanthobacteraceae bacterium]
MARAEAVNAIFGIIEDGFDLLPANLLLRQGRVTYSADTGAADAYLVTLAQVPTVYTAGLNIYFKAGAANTGASTVNVNGLGVKSIKKKASGAISALAANDIIAGEIVHIVYDGTDFQKL